MLGESILLWVPTVSTCAVEFYNINSATTEHMLLGETFKTKVKLEYNTDTVQINISYLRNIYRY